MLLILLFALAFELYINTHNVTDFVVCAYVPSQFVGDDALISSKVDLEYMRWSRKNLMLIFQLYSTCSNEILLRVLGCSHSHQLWDCLFNYFQRQTRARAKQLRVELRALTLNNCIFQEYLLKIHTIVDSLASIGDPAHVSHHIEVIFEGLPSYFALVVLVVESKFGLMDLNEVEMLFFCSRIASN